ncbi:MAG: hypothetical protein DSM106950_11300 [Stigonema ocellatum SAG 48.90 = DSM 106950]|nr:hypothetical protein [Stigonema ocellatum SAG 48.90 = DSM 106950]
MLRKLEQQKAYPDGRVGIAHQPSHSKVQDVSLAVWQYLPLTTGLRSESSVL